MLFCIGLSAWFLIVIGGGGRLVLLWGNVEIEVRL